MAGTVVAHRQIGRETSKPFLSHILPPTSPHLLISYSVTRYGLSIRICEPLGLILIQTTTTPAIKVLSLSAHLFIICFEPTLFCLLEGQSVVNERSQLWKDMYTIPLILRVCLPSTPSVTFFILHFLPLLPVGFFSVISGCFCYHLYFASVF